MKHKFVRKNGRKKIHTYTSWCHVCVHNSKGIQAFHLDVHTLHRAHVCVSVFICMFADAKLRIRLNRWLIFSAGWFTFTIHALTVSMQMTSSKPPEPIMIRLKRLLNHRNRLSGSYARYSQLRFWIHLYIMSNVDRLLERHSSLLQDVYVSIRTRSRTHLYSCFANLRDCHRRRAHSSTLFTQRFEWCATAVLKRRRRRRKNK